MAVHTMVTVLPDISAPPPTEDVTTIVTKGPNTDGDGDLAALTGGIVGAVVFLLICMIVVLLWCTSRHKGSYVTNETDDEDIDDNEDDESIGSDAAFQSTDLQKIKEEE